MKAVLYARVSSKEQEEEGYSIPSQVKLLREYALKNTLQVVREFTDVETAKQAGRSSFGEMVSFLQKTPGVKIILCEKTDRLYRNFRDYVTIDDLDVEIHLVKENEVLNKNSKSHQKFIHGIKVLMAKNYIDNLSEEASKGMREKAEQGLYPSYAPLGYLNNLETKTIEVDSVRASIVQQMFRLYATGSYSLRQILEFATREGLRGRKGHKIYRSAVEHILKNPIYHGEFVWNGKSYKGSHPTLISKELFDTVQQVFRGKRGATGGKRVFAFTGLLNCGKCGCAITAELKKGRYVYYHCTGYKGRCKEPYLREEVLDEKLAGVLKNIQINEDILNWLIKGLKLSQADKEAYREAQLKALNEQYERLRVRIEQIYTDRLDGKVTEDLWQKKTEEWSKEQEEVRKAIERHEKANKDYLELGIKLLELAKSAYSEYVTHDSEKKRKILQFVLSNCTLTDGTLTPTYRKPFNWIAEGLVCSNWLPREDSNLGPSG